LSYGRNNQRTLRGKPFQLIPDNRRRCFSYHESIQLATGDLDNKIDSRGSTLHFLNHRAAPSGGLIAL